MRTSFLIYLTVLAGPFMGALVAQVPPPLPPQSPAPKVVIHPHTSPLVQVPSRAGTPAVPPQFLPRIATNSPGVPSAPVVQLNPLQYLAFDSVNKEYVAKPGETNANFVFSLTNISSQEVSINSLRPSCGCTVAKLPSTPWKLPPGSNGQIEVSMNIAGRQGIQHKSISMETSVGWQTFQIKVTIPQMAVIMNAMGNRATNQKLAAADRQAVFKNDCASCHATPAQGKAGKELYAAVCAICHDGDHRATFVPDLKALAHPTDREHWKKWIAFGRVGSLMPAFAQAEGGPLNEEQIHSLAEFLAQTVPSTAQKSPSPTASSGR